MKPWRVAFSKIARQVFHETTERSQQNEIASQRFRELPEFSSYKDEVIRQGLMEFLAAERHQFNSELRNGKKNDPAWRAENIPEPKTHMGSKAAQDACDWYHLKIGGRDLGDLTFGELPAIRDSFAAQMKTAREYMNFLDRIIGLRKPDGVLIRDAKVGRKLEQFAVETGIQKPNCAKACA